MRPAGIRRLPPVGPRIRGQWPLSGIWLRGGPDQCLLPALAGLGVRLLVSLPMHGSVCTGVFACLWVVLFTPPLASAAPASPPTTPCLQLSLDKNLKAFSTKRRHGFKHWHQNSAQQFLSLLNLLRFKMELEKLFGTSSRELLQGTLHHCFPRPNCFPNCFPRGGDGDGRVTQLTPGTDRLPTPFPLTVVTVDRKTKEWTRLQRCTQA